MFKQHMMFQMKVWDYHGGCFELLLPATTKSNPNPSHARPECVDIATPAVRLPRPPLARRGRAANFREPAGPEFSNVDYFPEKCFFHRRRYL